MPLKDQLDAAGEIQRLEMIAARIRRDSMEYVTKSKVGHVGGPCQSPTCSPQSISGAPPAG
jgi:hypothetical protein